MWAHRDMKIQIPHCLGLIPLSADLRGRSLLPRGGSRPRHRPAPGGGALHTRLPDLSRAGLYGRRVSQLPDAHRASATGHRPRAEPLWLSLPAAAAGRHRARRHAQRRGAGAMAELRQPQYTPGCRAHNARLYVGRHLDEARRVASCSRHHAACVGSQ